MTWMVFPFMQTPSQHVSKLARRLLRIPHQKSYYGLRAIQSEPSSVFLDIGANHGQSIESFRLFKPKNPIVSFEINWTLAAKIHAPNVTVHPVGLGSENRDVTLYIPAFGRALFDARGSMIKEAASRFFGQHLFGLSGRLEEMPCQIKTLDSFDLNPFFVKIDVEGVEASVIQGGWETIKRARPILMIEHGHQLAKMLEPLGYEVYCYDKGFHKGRRGNPDAYLVPQNKQHLLLTR